jgi:hypothetical protein
MKNTLEVWKKIKESPFYLVSNYGNIKSVFRIVERANKRPYTSKERIMKPATDDNGYLRCGLSIDGKLRTFKVHRLVASAFCKGMTLEKNEVNHINGIKSDNRAENLEWITRSANCKHSFDTGLQKPKKGMLNGHSKLKDSDIKQIRQMFLEGYSSRKIAKIYNMDKTIFLDIKNGKCWSHV